MFKFIGEFIGVVVGIVMFCWATVSAFSIFSELKFLVDGWTWSVDQVPISIKGVSLAVGKYVSGIVGGYREVVHGLVAMLHLPRLPQFAYDTFGVITFSVGRGYWLGADALRRWLAERVYGELMPPSIYSDFPVLGGARGLFVSITGMGFSGPIVHWRLRITLAFCLAVIYGVPIVVILAALFGIDYLYRHFA